MLLIAGQLDPTFAAGGKVLTDFMGVVNAYGYRAAIQNDGKIVVTGHGGGPHFFVARYTVNGSLDSTFGSGGQILPDLTINFNPSTDVVSVAIQADGKIVVSGTNDTGSGSTSAVFFVERFNSDGSLDPTFGTGGKVSAGIGNMSIAHGLALQADGKIVVVGSVNGNSTSAIFGEFGVFRFNPDGNLDGGFGTGGKVVTVFGGKFDIPSGVAIQDDGKIVVGGSAQISGNNVLALARYNGNGTLDNAFGSGGMVTGAGLGFYPSIALQPDGRIILAGMQPDQTAGSLLVRYNPNGQLDSTFGMAGEVTTQFGANDVIVQADGKIVTVGVAAPQATATQTFAVARYNSDGSLDTTFGSGGEVVTDFGSRGPANGVALQSDGKIVAVGTGSVSPVINGLALARYNPDGSPDAAFGMTGKVISAIRGTVVASANALALQSDGKIVTAGGPFDLARYNPDGSLDPTFGTGGKVTSDFGTANGVALQADGKIVVVGLIITQSAPSSRQSFAIARYNADGSADMSFGVGGVVTNDFGGFASATAVAIQGDAKIVVVGSARVGLTNDFALARYNPDGTLDTSFGVGGQVTTAFSSAYASASGVVLQADGEILVVGDATVFGPGTSDISTTLAMARYNPGGSLDQKFGTSGQLTSPKASDQSTVDQAIGVALQADGRIVVAGFIRTTFSDHDFAVLRLLVNGNLDPSFGIGGSVTIDFGGNDDARSVAVQADGKIVAAGVTVSLTAVTQSGFLQTSFAVARLNSDGSLDPTFGAGGKATTDFGDHVDAPRAVAIQPDGKTVLAGGFGSTIHPPFRGDSFAVARYLPDNVGTPNQRFVEQVYWDLLKRPVDSSGLTTWTRSLDQGLSHAQVAAAIQSSPEYHTLVVGDLYKLVLGRTVDASGSMTWVSFLSQGHPAEQLEAILLSSDEFFVGHGSDNNNGFLPALYQVVLQRPIDSAGSQHWGQALQSGALSRQAVAAAVLASLESDQLEVQNLYMQFLHRATDPGGLDTFTSALQHGLSDEQVALILVGSAEYFARV